MNCKNCNAEVSDQAKFCSNCGEKVDSVDNIEGNVIGRNCIVSIVMSIISFILTTIIRYNVHEKIDLTPSALSHHWGMSVPSEMKPIVLAVPVIFTLITIMKTVMSSDMSKKEKGVSYVIAAFSLMASIAIVNWRYEI